MALAALTRIDLSKNRLKVLSGQLLQLQSLRSLNAANNEISEIEIPCDGIQAPLLESLSLEYNELSALPDDVCFYSFEFVKFVGHLRNPSWPRFCDLKIRTCRRYQNRTEFIP